MRSRRVLITGVSRSLGARLARTLAEDPGIETVVGVDTVAPHDDLGNTHFVRADIRNPMIAKILATSSIDTVVHMNLIATPAGAGGRASMKETNVIGTMQLLAACQKSPSVRKLVVKSTTAVYGTSPRDPALFTEETEPHRFPRGGYTKDAVEVESYVRGFGRRRPDVAVTLLRFATILGPHTDSALTRYLSLAVVPTVLGYDPRLQLCHERDALEILRIAALEDRPGIVNAGGPGLLLLSQAIRRTGRPFVPVPSPALNLTGSISRRLGLLDFSPEQVRLLEHGRVADVSRLQKVFGYTPEFSTEAVLEDWIQGSGVRRIISPETVAALEASLLGVVDAGRQLVESRSRTPPPEPA